MLRAYQRVPHVILRRNIISNLRLLGGLGRYSSTSTTQFLAQPVVANLVKGLTATQPSFGLSAEAIKVLRTPDEFYQTLLSMIRRAKKTIHISSLYIGTAEKELIDTLHEALSRNPSLTLNLHLDLLRSTRPETPSTAEFLLPLLKTFPERVHIHLYRTPKLKGLMAKLVPRRFDEGWGTWHAKIYAVDDEAMISGANLNSSYFTNRQDRYLYFSNQPHLTQYLRDFLGQFIPYTYRLLPVGDNGYHLEWWNDMNGPTSFEEDARNSLVRLQDRYRMLATMRPAFGDTMIIPIIQAGALGVREEERAIGTLLDEVSKSPIKARVDLTSGYFGLYQHYQERVVDAPDHVNWKIVAASPLANGFYGSKGLSGRLPEAYTWLESKFWKAVQKAGKKSGSVELEEWERPGWTYHAKGIWVRFHNDVQRNSYPVISLFGSTNLNSRSAKLDTELSFIMVTESESLSRQLGDEVDGIREHSKTVGPATWASEDRRVRYSTMAMARVVSGML